MITPKGIIIEALKTKFEGTGIRKLVLVFNVKSDNYNIMVAQDNDKPLKLELEQKDISVIKKVLVSKLERKIRQEFKKDFKTFSVVFDFTRSTLEVFIEDIFGVVTKFDY
jgi:hypothetical protein